MNLTDVTKLSTYELVVEARELYQSGARLSNAGRAREVFNELQDRGEQLDKLKESRTQNNSNAGTTRTEEYPNRIPCS